MTHQERYRYTTLNWNLLAAASRCVQWGRLANETAQVVSFVLPALRPSLAIPAYPNPHRVPLHLKDSVCPSSALLRETSGGGGGGGGVKGGGVAKDQPTFLTLCT